MSSAPGGAGGGEEANPVLLVRTGGANLTHINSTAAGDGGGLPSWVAQLPYNRLLILTIQKYLIILIVLTIMVSMGCHIHYLDVWTHLKKPTGIGLGLFCQFVWMPLIGYAFQILFHLNEYHSMGLMIIATTPGGSISNLFSYWSKGDVPLSVCMTAFSTLTAFGMMPLNLYIYQRSSVQAVPYASIASALAVCVIPVLVGMFIRHKWPKLSAKITKAGSRLGILGIAISITMQSMANPHMFLTSWRPYAAVCLFPVSGLAAGYITATLTCLPHAQRRTVAIETGCQNVAMAIALVLLVFTGERLTHVMLVPFLYGIFSITEMALFTGITRGMMRCGLCLDPDHNQHDNHVQDSGEKIVDKPV